MNRRSARWLLSIAAWLAVGQTAQAQDVPTIARDYSPAVFRIVGEVSDGTGFLVDRGRGLVATNAHVIEGGDSVGVQLTPHYKISGQVVASDRRADVAVVQVSPTAVADVPEIRPSSGAHGSLELGDGVVLLGHPAGSGVVVTTGIVSQLGESIFLTDGAVHGGNSGGPVAGPDGTVVGMTTFLTGGSRGPGLGGAIVPDVIDRVLDRVTALGDPPPADSLPTMPLDQFPLEAIEQARAAEDWPVGVYDISSAGIGMSDVRVELVTPPLVSHLRGGVSDLRYWAQELGDLPPVVIARIYPEVGQSTGGVLANLAIGALAGALGTRASRVYDPVVKARIGNVRVQVDGSVTTPIELKRSVSQVGSVRVPVIHVVLPQDAFRVVDGQPSSVILNVEDVDGAGFVPWVVPEETVRQIDEDFQEYRVGSR